MLNIGSGDLDEYLENSQASMTIKSNDELFNQTVKARDLPPAKTHRAIEGGVFTNRALSLAANPVIDAD